MNVIKILTDIGYFIIGVAIFFGPAFAVAYALEYFDAPGLIVDIFVFAYVLVMIVWLLTYTVGCHSFHPGRRGLTDE